jgi:acyl-coenzyme A synthetase/AMP-(fatty) acid ligase
VVERRGRSKQKWPERLVTVPELPMTPSGQILRHVLRERLMPEGGERERSTPGRGR